MKIFAANWKLFKSPRETRQFFLEFKEKSQSLRDELVFFPPATSWEAAAESLGESKIFWGAQNIWTDPQGAFTGENSAQVLKDLGGRYVLVGHSERRKLFGETNALLAKKVQTVSKLGLTPMLCIGETLEEREKKATNAVNEKQLREGLSLIAAGGPLVVAYEPVWAIGTGRVATPEQAQEAHLYIKKILKDLGFADTKVLYGGSVKPDNAGILLSQPSIDGFLVGGASLEVKSFLEICQAKH